MIIITMILLALLQRYCWYQQINIKQLICEWIVDYVLLGLVWIILSNQAFQDLLLSYGILLFAVIVNLLVAKVQKDNKSLVRSIKEYTENEELSSIIYEEGESEDITLDDNNYNIIIMVEKNSVEFVWDKQCCSDHQIIKLIEIITGVVFQSSILHSDNITLSVATLYKYIEIEKCNHFKMDITRRFAFESNEEYNLFKVTPIISFFR